MTFLFYFQPFLLDGYFITQNERSIRFYEKDVKTIVYGLLSSCYCRYCFTNYTRSCGKQAILDGVKRACRYH